MTQRNIGNKLLLILASLALVAGFTISGSRQLIASGPSWAFHDIVEVEFVKSHSGVPMPSNVMLIDARPYKPMYVKGHIPGAVSIPHSDFDKNISMLPKDKNTLLIYYCGGLKCKLSHKSAKKAEELGYQNVKVFAKGFPEWMTQKGSYASVSAEYVSAAIAENQAMVFDSRPLKTKYVKGHIPTAVSLPFSQFDKLSGKLPRSPDTPLIFYCGGLKCKLSHKSAAKAIEMGYTNVSVFAEGYPKWKKAYGGDGASVQVAAGEIEGSIDLERFKRIVATEPDSIMLIDVRDPDEFAQGSFKTAVNIPVAELESRISSLPATKPIVYVCSTGARSGEAYYMTKDIRESLEDVYYVEAGIEFMPDGSFKISKTP